MSIDTTAPTMSKPPRWKLWLLAIRPFSFTTSTVPVIAASALALLAGSLDLPALLLMLLASMATHAGCNLANDYYDDESGVDRKQPVGNGGALQLGWLTRRDLAVAIVIAFAIALVAALPIMIAIGPPIIVLAILSAAAAFFYTGGPFPLAYWALGEITVFLAMGTGMVAGAYYVHTGTISAAALWLGTAMGLLSAGILHANNIRDRDTDRAHHKRTIANLTSRHFANREYQALIIAPLVILIMLVALDPAGWPILIALATVPRIAHLARAVTTAHETVPLNRILRQTAGLHLQYGLLVATGYVLATIPGLV